MDEFFAQLAKHLAPALVAEMRRVPADTVSQNGSPLGRDHCRIVRERIERGEPGAYIGPRRQHLLTREALEEELARKTPKRLRKAQPEPARDGDDIETRIMRKLPRTR